MQAVTQVNLIQPRDADHVRTNERGGVDVEPVRKWRRLSRRGKQQSIAPRRSTGVLGMACTNRHTAQIGDPLVTKDTRRAKEISRRVAASGADEAIVSVDAGGHYNRRSSQGPLDEIGWQATPRTTCPSGPQGVKDQPWTPYKSGFPRRRSAPTSRLKPYWGKPAVRNFREGEGNTMAQRVSQTLHGQCDIQLEHAVRPHSTRRPNPQVQSLGE